LTNTLAPLSISVVIPTYNGRKLLEKNLPSVLMATPKAEIIVVDDASSDGTIPWLQSTYPLIKIARQEVNQRFAAACNLGVKQATGEIILLLNNDVQPQADFLSYLMEPFQDDRVFAVGCKEKESESPDAAVQGRAGGNFKRGLLVHWPCKDQDGDLTLWAFGGSAAFRTKMWRQLGGMDTLFTPAYEEDRDISYRALKRGWQIKFASKSVVYHHHESTNSTALGKKNMQIASYKNQLLMVWKNITCPSYVLQHLLWLPYHLIFTTIRSKGDFWLGFTWALRLLPQVLQKRAIEQEEAKVSDKEILKKYSALK
jgi:GT2 family glycosyltransferase